MVSTPILFAAIAITRGKLHEINHDLSRLPTPEPLSRSSTNLSSSFPPSTGFQHLYDIFCLRLFAFLSQSFPSILSKKDVESFNFLFNFSLVRTQSVTRILKVDIRVVHVRRPLAIG